MRLKFILLAATAALTLPISLQAADMPGGKLSKVEYMKACSSYGTQFYFIPGSDTCLRVGGFARAEYVANSTTSGERWRNTSFGTDPSTRNSGLTHSIASIALQLDARSQTEYGTLQSYADLRFHRRTGEPFGATLNGGRTDLVVWNAYMKLGGFTVGRIQSFFDFYANADVLGTDIVTIGSDSMNNLIAYTAEFGNGLSATVSLEDATARRVQITDTAASVVGSGTGYAGQAMPDIVGNIAIEQRWGSAQLSAVLHQNRPNYAAATGWPETEYGWAVQGGVLFNLPALSPEDKLTLQAAYADGAIAYLGAFNPQGVSAMVDSSVWGSGALARLEHSHGWSAAGQFLHYWSSSLKSAFFGGYAVVEQNLAMVAPAAGFNFREIKSASAGGTLVWSPVNNLDMGVQFDWSRVDIKGRADEQSMYRTLLIMQRNF